MSVLAIEDCLISKLSTLFRSNNVIEMSPEDISGLVGETQDSSLGRKRLETKRTDLEKGLRGLKSLHKHRNVNHPPQQDQVAPENPERISTMTSSRSEKASMITYDAEASPRATTPYESPRSLEPVVVPSAVDEWLPRAASPANAIDGWGAAVPRAKERPVF